MYDYETNSPYGNATPWGTYSDIAREVVLSEGITSIGAGAFRCTKISDIRFPSTLQRIGVESFYACPVLEEICIPDSVTRIEERAFYDSFQLKSVLLSESLEYMGDKAFNYEGISGTEHEGGLYIGSTHNPYLVFVKPTDEISESVSISDHTKMIADNTFYSCSNLTSVTIPESVTSIGNDAFYSCSSLTSVTIPNSVTSIGNGAFSDCSSLTSVTFENPTGWRVSTSSTATSGRSIAGSELANDSIAATYLRDTYCSCYWKRG